MRVAVVQMVTSSSVEENLKLLNAYFTQAYEAEAKLVVLPENFAFMGKKPEDILSVAETFHEGIVQQTVSDLAKKFKLWVIAGTQAIKTSSSRVRSRCIVYDDAGLYVAHYDKIHLFDVSVSAKESHQESQFIEPGEKIVVVDTPIGRVGLSVCYDLRFPELYRYMEEEGAEIFAIPSAFTKTTGKVHWEVLLRARAIENLCYVLAPNQGGIHDNGRETFGHSKIVNPWGNILIQQEGMESVICSEIDLQYLKQLREQFPCNEHHVLKMEI